MKNSNNMLLKLCELRLLKFQNNVGLLLQYKRCLFNFPFRFCNRNKRFDKEFLGVRSMMDFVHDKAFINNTWVSGKSNATFDVINPATEKVIGKVPNLEVGDVKLAVQAAHEAFPVWSKTTAAERSKFLTRMKSEIDKNIGDIAKVITLETGKPIGESISEVIYSVSFLEYFLEQGKRLDGEIYQSHIGGQMALSIKQPIGVAAVLTPWNFPLAMIMRKTSAALSVGCTCVIKPSEVTPLTALAYADLAQRCELPKGVMNVVTGDRQHSSAVGILFCQSPLVAGLSFTGSTKVGKILYKQCSATVKRISLELGGNAPFIVFNSADLEKAAEGGMKCKFRNCGQACIGANRFFIQEEVYGKYLELMKDKMSTLKIGNGLVPGVNMGPLTNKRDVDKMDKLVKDAVSKGAKLLVGGKRVDVKKGYFYHATLLSDVKPNMLCYKTEIFGPIVACTRFKTEEEVMRMSNDTRLGLAGYLYSNDLAQIFRVTRRLEVGMVGVNSATISVAEAPFGGVKESGIGREACHHGMEEYVDIKYVCIDKGEISKVK